MSFDRIDRAFQRKPSALVRLECASCGTTDQVAMLFPLWAPRVPGPAVEDPLCPACARRNVPVRE